MKRNRVENKHAETVLADRGAVTVQTKGGTMGFEDQELTKWLHGFGLADD